MKQMQIQHRAQPRSSGPVMTESRRVPLERKVILKFHHFGGFFIEYSANISLTGMFIKTVTPKPPGSIFIFEIWLGDEYKLVHGVGEVIWSRAEGEGVERPNGMGIRFLKIDDESRKVVERVIAEHLQKGGEMFDLDSTTPGQSSEPERRAELELVEPISMPLTQEDLLMFDEELLGIDPSPADEVAPVSMLIESQGAGSRLRAALLLVLLAAVMGGAAYLLGADLLPF